MNPEIKAKWVAALRSGKYAQGNGELRCGDGKFCCLGVLCDLQGEDGWVEGNSDKTDVAIYGYRHDGMSNFELPPLNLRQVWGLDWLAVEVEIDGMHRRLYDHNDSGKTFAQIADAIESQL